MIKNKLRQFFLETSGAISVDWVVLTASVVMLAAMVIAAVTSGADDLAANTGDYITALSSYKQSLEIREQLKDTVRIARLANNISIVHESLGNYPEALSAVLDYLSFSEQLKSNHQLFNEHTNNPHSCLSTQKPLKPTDIIQVYAQCSARLRQ